MSVTKMVITTVGVSLLENILLRRQQLRELGMPSADEVEGLKHELEAMVSVERITDLANPQIQDTAQAFEQALTSLWASKARYYTADEGRRKREYSPAELASLSLLDLQPEDGVYLLYSQTAKGVFCATVLQQVLNQGAGVPAGVKVDKEMIEGLQVEDLQRFTDEGAVKFVRAVERIKADQSDDVSVLLNITGGYKGLTPIATIAAMALKVELCYLYEDSDEMLRLKPLDVDLGFSSLFTNNWGAMEQITPIERPLPRTPEERFWELTDVGERRELEKYVKSVNGMVQLSPLGVLAWALHTHKSRIGQAPPRGPLTQA
jgi:putative CRISPR-associated protein (TIGR02619 family)